VQNLVTSHKGKNTFQRCVGIRSLGEYLDLQERKYERAEERFVICTRLFMNVTGKKKFLGRKVSTFTTLQNEI
jgi:hypothetical protein